VARVFRLSCLVIFSLALSAGRTWAQSESAPTSVASMRPEAYYEFLRGSHLEGRGQVNEAISAFERAASLDPHAADIPAELAALYARQGNLAGARQSADAALKIDPDNVDAHRVLGGIFASMAESDDNAAKGAGSDVARMAIDHLERGRRPDGTDQDTGLDIALARMYLRLGDNQQAVEVLHRITEYEPDAGEAYVLLARAESALGHPDKAIAAVEEAADGNPRLLPTLAQLYEDQKQWTNAARTYERLAEVNPTSLDVKTRWAAALLQEDDNEGAATKAKELLTEVAAGAPTEPRPLYLLSMAERKRRNFAAAEAAARRLMTLDPSSATGPFALAQVYEDQRLFGKAAEVLAPAVARLDDKDDEGRRDLLALLAHLGFAQLQAGLGSAAVKTFERARALTGSGGSFDTSLIQAYLMARQYDRAADLARAARLRQPSEPRFAELEARAVSQAGRKDRAVVIMRDAVTANPTDVAAQLTLAQMLDDAGRTNDADRVLEDAAKKFPADVRVPFERGALLEKRKDYSGAETAFREALTRDPLHAPSLNYLGYMLAERGDRLDEAVALVERALTIDPGNGSYLDSLGWAYVQQKRFDKAEPLLRQAADQLPGNSVVQDHFGDLLWAIGRRQEATAAWRRALDGDREQVDVKGIEKKLDRAR
jgi:tetratricopeptide (TPR) repeat protein